MSSDFDLIINNIEQQQLWSFPGGVHPDGRKQLSNQSSIAEATIPNALIVPLKQHIGESGSCLVSTGDKVGKGQPLTSTNHAFSIPVHAPTSGEIIAIEPRVSAHPSGLTEPCIVIQPDGLDTWVQLEPIDNYASIEKSTLVNAISDAGISGMGGAGFPTHIKAASNQPIEFLIVNGVECEPYITADDRLMREHAWQIRQGVDILMYIVAPKAVIIAIEDNKPEAFSAMRQVCQDNAQIRVVQIPTKYPAGGEKQLIQTLTGREVPRDGLPGNIGVATFNVGTCYAIADAILYGKPLIQRVVTLTGEAISAPQNTWALIGTPTQELLEKARYQAKQQQTPTVIMGGPMMGFTLPSTDVPVVKTTNCLLIPAHNELQLDMREMPCIRCGACAEACPATLLPQQLYWHTKAGELNKAQEYNLFDCIECGACAYVCPSEIPLVHYYRKAKAQIRAQNDEKEKSEKSKQRFEARKARLEQEKLEREEKHKKAALARQNKATDSASNSHGAKDKVAAALARAKAKKAQLQEPSQRNSGPQRTATSGSDNKAKVAAAIERAKAKRQQAIGDTPSQEIESAMPSAEEPKKAKVAAAVARAKAKRQQSAGDATSQGSESAAPSAEEQKKAKVAAAVARAKAKRQQAPNDAASQGSESVATENDSSNKVKAAHTSPEETTSESAKEQRKAKIAAALKAKNKDSNGNSALSPQDEQTSAQEQRKAKIAAAIARAKEKKAARDATHINEEDQ